jgi:phosphoribosylformylglycinamidine cyclo-ligase
MATYQEAGVNISTGESLVNRIKKSVRSTYSHSVIGDIGLFGAFYDARFKGYKSPVLVTSVDGVGTKLLVAKMMNRHNTIGRDLVNHCVNDILCCGAKPLYFLDYFAAGKLNPSVAEQVISGFVAGCKENKCSLIGGETAEMPGIYDDGTYDISGTIVGLVEKQSMITGARIKRGDVLLGLRSSGLHTNGYSLARSVLLGRYSIDDHIETLGSTLGEVLLQVHRSYLGIILSLMKKVYVKGISHITGGGIEGNTKRIIPAGRSLKVDWSAWQPPPIFELIQSIGKVPTDDMRRTFNLGIGMIVIVSNREADAAQRFLRKQGEHSILMGEVVAA